MGNLHENLVKNPPAIGVSAEVQIFPSAISGVVLILNRCILSFVAYTQPFAALIPILATQIISQY